MFAKKACPFANPNCLSFTPIHFDTFVMIETNLICGVYEVK
jgi:hypothetical protein